MMLSHDADKFAGVVPFQLPRSRFAAMTPQPTSKAKMISFLNTQVIVANNAPTSMP